MFGPQKGLVSLLTTETQRHREKQLSFSSLCLCASVVHRTNKGDIHAQLKTPVPDGLVGGRGSSRAVFSRLSRRAGIGLPKTTSEAGFSTEQIGSRFTNIS
jgi:hypothetical protein